MLLMIIQFSICMLTIFYPKNSSSGLLYWLLLVQIKSQTVFLAEVASVVCESSAAVGANRIPLGPA